jgi:hypothetical protein
VVASSALAPASPLVRWAGGAARESLWLLRCWALCSVELGVAAGLAPACEPLEPDAAAAPASASPPTAAVRKIYVFLIVLSFDYAPSELALFKVAASRPGCDPVGPVIGRGAGIPGCSPDSAGVVMPAVHFEF